MTTDDEVEAEERRAEKSREEEEEEDELVSQAMSIYSTVTVARPVTSEVMAPTYHTQPL